MDNYMQYMGQTGVNTHTYVSERLKDCFVCSANFADWKLENVKEMKLSALYSQLKTDHNLFSPSLLTMDGDIIYISSPPILAAMH